MPGCCGKSIIDEPSAEYELYRNFAEYCEGRTSILISHRLSNVNTRGRIFCLDSGELSESGSHRELAAAGNGYALAVRETEGGLCVGNNAGIEWPRFTA